MYEVILVIFVIVAVALVVLIMLQQHKSADMVTYSKNSTSNMPFSSAGSNAFMIRATSILAILFFIFSLVLGNINNTLTNNDKLNKTKKLDISEKSEQIQQFATSSPELTDVVLQ